MTGLESRIRRVMCNSRRVFVGGCRLPVRLRTGRAWITLATVPLTQAGRVEMARRPRKPKGHRSTREVEIDEHVGSRIRTRRTLLGLSQEKLGDALGLSFQQVQKYERGSNRVGAGRLYQISKVLDVPVSNFYEDMPEEPGQSPPPRSLPTQDDANVDTMHKRETLELVRAYYRIENAAVRKRLYETVRAVAGEGRRGRQPNVRS